MPQPDRAAVTRRQLIARIAQAGGSAYAGLLALGLLDDSPSRPFKLAGSGAGTRVIILGAGLAGLCAAYELRRLGYDPQVLEARDRPGGRAWTVRRGTEETEIGGERQAATFDEGLYFNPGPARIPQHHHATLHYCRELGVAVEPFINANDAAWYYHEDGGPLSGRRVRLREAKADMRGYTSELLAKAVRRDALDEPVTQEDRERLVDYLRREGDLGPDLRYRGSSRRGYAVPPGAGPQPGAVGAPLDLGALLRSGAGDTFSLEYAFPQQMPMFQITGGTDGLPRAFAKRLGDRIRYGAEVMEIRRRGDGVAVVYSERGHQRQITGAHCICAIPLSVLRDIPADFSPQMRAAIGAVAYEPAGKIGLQFGRRFWEEDDQIFGGISRTALDITQIWYPSSGFLSQKGIVVGAYSFGGAAAMMGSLSPRDREVRALAQGRRIHPQYDATFETSFSVAWHRVRYSLGGWASYSTADRERHYPVLNEPDGPIYLAGEHLSYLTGWMAGALESARRVTAALHARVQASRR